MACEFFIDGHIVRCGAVEGVLVPSHHERERYCKSNGERRCPTFRLHQLRRRPVSQEDYYALWVPRDLRPITRSAAAH
jgi:hypothetical protein